MSEFSDPSSASSSELAPNWRTHEFVVPGRAIMEQRDMEQWKRSNTCAEILSFVKCCTESVVGKKRSDVAVVAADLDGNRVQGLGEEQLSVPVTKFVEFMRLMQTKVDVFPPLKQPMRFGNKAFKQWQACLVEECPKFLRDLLPEDLHGAIPELVPYLATSFGNEVRIDYGTGHETTIIVFFLCLYKLRVIGVADCAQVVLRGFVEYVRTMRRLQVAYLLEPAGSHGAWGLDDYHCLIFLFGSAQLCSAVGKDGGGGDGAGAGGASTAAARSSDEAILPSSVHNPDVLEEGSDEYMYLEGIKFIKFLKTGAPFAETSPMLNDISGLGDWSKICTGLLRLYQAEVLHKFPVVQHLLFGTILTPPGVSHSALAAPVSVSVSVPVPVASAAASDAKD